MRLGNRNDGKKDGTRNEQHTMRLMVGFVRRLVIMVTQRQRWTEKEGWVMKRGVYRLMTRLDMRGRLMYFPVTLIQIDKLSLMDHVSLSTFVLH
jgi:hypothetical protein